MHLFIFVMNINKYNMLITFFCSKFLATSKTDEERALPLMEESDFYFSNERRLYSSKKPDLVEWLIVTRPFSKDFYYWQKHL